MSYEWRYTPAEREELMRLRGEVEQEEMEAREFFCALHYVMFWAGFFCGVVIWRIFR